MEIETIFQRLFEVPECLELINNRDQSEEVPLHIAAGAARVNIQSPSVIPDAVARVGLEGYQVTIQ
jgi:hypothetical protein